MATAVKQKIIHGRHPLCSSFKLQGKKQYCQRQSLFFITVFLHFDLIFHFLYQIDYYFWKTSEIPTKIVICRKFLKKLQNTKASLKAMQCSIHLFFFCPFYLQIKALHKLISLRKTQKMIRYQWLLQLQVNSSLTILTTVLFKIKVKCLSFTLKQQQIRYFSII